MHFVVCFPVCFFNPTQACGWRSIFMLLAGLAALVILPLLVFCVPETLQYKVLQQLSRRQQGNAVNVKEAQAILGKVRHFFVHCCMHQCEVSDRDS